MGPQEYDIGVGKYLSQPQYGVQIFLNPGTGQQIALGKDQILGLGNISFLSNNCIFVLYQKNIKTLAQVKKLSED
jgi:hypothetical protein